MPSTQINPFVLPTPGLATTSIQVCNPNPTRTSLSVYNASSTVAIAICPIGTAAVVNGAGSITLPPGEGVNLPGWTAGLNGIAASGSGNPITVYEFS